MAGIKETKEVLDFVFALVTALSKSLDDGKLDLTDALEFLPSLTKAGAAFSDMSLIPAEMADLSDEERQALVAYAKANLDLPDDNLEKNLELAIEVGLYLGQLIYGVKK